MRCANGCVASRRPQCPALTARRRAPQVPEAAHAPALALRQSRLCDATGERRDHARPITGQCAGEGAGLGRAPASTSTVTATPGAPRRRVKVAVAEAARPQRGPTTITAVRSTPAARTAPAIDSSEPVSTTSSGQLALATTAAGQSAP